MIRRLIWLLFIIILTIVSLSFYLNVDDLDICGSKPDELTNCQPADAIVVVSGGDTKSRVDEAIRLYNNGWSRRLIFSGAAQDKSGPSNAAAMRTIAINQNIPALSIWLDEYSINTTQNAQHAKTIFKELDIKKAILVTSGYHQKRAGLEFNKRIDDVEIINHSTTSDPDWSANWWWLTPRGWWLAISETIKIIYFYIASFIQGRS